MSRLEELIAELCPKGVKYLPIKKCVNPVKKIKWSNTDGETYQYIDLSSVDRDIHTITETTSITKDNAPSRAQQIVETGDVLLGATRPMLKRYCMISEDYDGQICSTGFCVLRAKENLILRRWLYHNISSTTFFEHVEKYQKGASYPAISDADVKAFEIPVPPLPVQEEIVRILDTFTSLTAELQAELQARRMQYEYYKDQMLPFEKTDVNWKTLGELSTIVRGASPRPIKNFVTEDIDGVNWIKIGDVASGAKYITSCAERITKEGAKKSRYVYPGDFILSNSMSFGRPYILKIEGCIHDGWLSISQFEDFVTPDYLYHVLTSSFIQKVMKQKASFGGAVQNLNADIVRSIEIPIPSKEEQEKIVSLLDRFSLLCNDISTGLPAEIEARQKQYEYYRDKLLTFKELS